MEKIDCRGGFTQIGRVLAHAREENARQKVSALVFVGDSMEEKPAVLYTAAHDGVPVFLFQPCYKSSRLKTAPFLLSNRLVIGGFCLPRSLKISPRLLQESQPTY